MSTKKDQEATKKFPKSIHRIVSEIQQEVGALVKNKAAEIKGKKYFYEDLNQILEVLTPLFKKYDVFCVNNVQEGELVTVLYSSDHSATYQNYMSVCCPLKYDDRSMSSMQAMGSAITYARRYNLKNLFNLYSEDSDGNDAGKQKATKEQADFLKAYYNNLDEAAKASMVKHLGTSKFEDVLESKAATLMATLKARA